MFHLGLAAPPSSGLSLPLPTCGPSSRDVLTFRLFPPRASLPTGVAPEDIGDIVMGSVLGSLRSILTVMALSVHSLFEGMAIGLDETQSGVWLLTGAVALHAVPIVFCIGTDMLTSGVKKMKLIVYMIILSLNTPIGILIGIIVTLHKDENDDSGGHILAIGILQGLAAGTLLYITFFEVLARDKLTKYVTSLSL